MLAVVAGFGVLAVFYTFMLRPNWDRAAALMKEQEQTEQQLQTANSTLERLKALEKQAKSFEVELVKAKKALPDEAEVSTLLIEISKIVEDSGVEMSSFSPGGSAASGSAQSMPVGLSLTGSFFDLLDLLSRIQSSPRYLKVAGLSISPSGEGKLTISLNLSAFFVNAPPQQAQ